MSSNAVIDGQVQVVNCCPDTFQDEQPEGYGEGVRRNEGEDEGGSEERSTKKKYKSHINKEPNERSRTLFITNIDYSVTQKDLEEAFSPFGKIETVRLREIIYIFYFIELTVFFTIVTVYNEPGRHRGYAHIQFEDEEDAVKVLASHSRDAIYLADRRVKMDYAREVKKNKFALYPHIRRQC